MKKTIIKLLDNLTDNQLKLVFIFVEKLSRA